MMKNTKNEKLAAYNTMQELRKMTAAYGLTDYDAEREGAVSEKYGEFMIKYLTCEEIVEQLAIARKNSEEGHVMEAHQASANIRKKYGFPKLTEEEFFRKVDEGLADIEAGRCIISESAEAELTTEFGLLDDQKTT